MENGAASGVESQESGAIVSQNPNELQQNGGAGYESTDEFARIQEESRRVSDETLSRYHAKGRGTLEFDDFKRMVGAVYGRLLARNGGSGNSGWSDLSHTDKEGKVNVFRIGQVKPSLFHDIFEVNRRYLENGELVDLHDNYDNCKCFLSDDGLCGFAVEPDGNLVSVFSLNLSTKRGFLYSIKDFVRKQGATHLDAYASNRQDLSAIYRKTIDFHVASEMDYNMDYDHDGIAENHGMPDVVFMVDHEVEKRRFGKDQYDDAVAWQMKQLEGRENIRYSISSPRTALQLPAGNSLANGQKAIVEILATATDADVAKRLGEWAYARAHAVMDAGLSSAGRGHPARGVSRAQNRVHLGQGL